MAKVIGLSIEIDGLSEITKEVVGLEQQLKQLNTELKNTEVGSDQYIKLRNEIAATKQQLSEAKKEQKDFIKSAEATKEAEGSYYQLNQQLADLRKAYKNLSAEERNSAKGQEMVKSIQKLDTELKQIDGSIGQFQRNVGNYPKTFALLNRSLMRSIPGFEAFSDQLKDSEGNMNLFGKALIGGFVAFQGAKLIGQAMKKLDEFISKIDETKEAVAEFSGASGEELNSLTAQTTALADTFDTDARTISEAAQKLAANMGISFDDALGKLEGALVEGRGNADEYLKTVSEYPEVFQEASGAVTDFSDKNKRLLSENKELAQSQVNVAERLRGLNEGFNSVVNTVKTGLLVALANIVDFLKPLVSTVGILIGYWYDLGKAIGSFITSLPIVKQIFEGLQAAGTAVLQSFREMPFVFSGIIEAIKQLGTNFKNFFESLYLDAQIFAQQVKGAFGANVEEAINDLRRRRAEVNADGAALGDAFNRGYNDAKKKAYEQDLKNQKAAATQGVKVNNEALKKQAEAARSAAEKLREERKKYTEQEAKDARARLALLADLQSRLIDEQIKNIQDGRAREIAENEANAKAQIEALNKQYADLKLAAEEREAELLKIFGKASKELAQTQAENAKLLTQVRAEQAKIAEQIEAQRLQKEKEINSAALKDKLQKAQDEADKLRAFRDEQLNGELSFIDSVGEQRALKNEETLNRLLIQEGDAKKREGIIRRAEEERILAEIEIIRNKQQALTDQEENLKAQADAGVEIKQEEFDAVLKARQELNTQLSSLELQQTEIIRQEAEKQTEIRKGQFEKIAGYAMQGLEIIDTVVSAINARAEADVEAQIERSTERQDRLNQDIENATGLRKKFLQQQLDNEVQAAEQLAKKQEDIQRRQARVQKGIAATQSVIQGILAVATALATPPAPNFVAAGIAGISAAAQTAAILAQPLADGGAVSPVVLPDSGGKVIAAQNIPTTGRGDNVLVAARVGETFLNAKQTKILRPALAAARIPGFATGGFLGAPNVNGIGGNTSMIRAMNARSAAISNQVLESKVYLVTDELKRDTAEGERIKKKVTLR
jgi:hypothetical protein